MQCRQPFDRILHVEHLLHVQAPSSSHVDELLKDLREATRRSQLSGMRRLFEGPLISEIEKCGLRAARMEEAASFELLLHVYQNGVRA